MHVKLIVFLWRVECALSPFDWQQLFTWLCDDDFCSCCWNVSHHYRPQSFSGLQSHPDDQTIWLNMSRDCNLLNMCIYIYIYTYIRNRLVGKCSCVLFSSHNICSASTYWALFHAKIDLQISYIYTYISICFSGRLADNSLQVSNRK